MQLALRNVGKTNLKLPQILNSLKPKNQLAKLGFTPSKTTTNQIPNSSPDEFELTYGQATDAQFITAVANNAKQTGETITLAGHSGGGLRNYLTLSNASQNQFLDANGNSVLKVQFSGTPVNSQHLLSAAQQSGVIEVKFQNHSGDTVGNALGMNGSIVEAIWSGVNTISLFEPEWKPNLNYLEQKAAWDQLPKNKKENIDPPKFFIPLKSDHSSYGCILSSCNSNTNLNLNFNQNSPLAPPINFNSNLGSQ